MCSEGRGPAAGVGRRTESVWQSAMDASARLLAAALLLAVAAAAARRLPAPALPNCLLDDADPDIHRTTPEMAAAAGYRLEKHEVVSEGYVLTLHRLPAHRNASRPPVLLQHGMLCASDLWLLGGPTNALAYMLVDAGYDVWLPNARGNTYSRKHHTMSTKTKHFWQFSWHEMGQQDLPRVVDYVLEATGQRQLLYVGHSMGTTMFYVMLSAHPQYANKVRAMVSLAPVVFIGGAPTMLTAIGAAMSHPLWRALDHLDLNLFSYRKQNAVAWTKLCGDGSPIQPLCLFFYSSIVGKYEGHFNKTRLPLYITRLQHGVTLRTLSHYNQLLQNGQFEAFDEGLQSNLHRYGRSLPPAYNLSHVRVPTALICGENDAFVPREGVERLARELPMVVVREMVRSLNHLDLTWSSDVRRLVNEPIIRFLDAAARPPTPAHALRTAG